MRAKEKPGKSRYSDPNGRRGRMHLAARKDAILGKGGVYSASHGQKMLNYDVVAEKT